MTKLIILLLVLKGDIELCKRSYSNPEREVLENLFKILIP